MKLTVTKKDSHLFRSGAYVGGIGAGGFEVRPDGKFYRCRMFNQWQPERDLDAGFIYNDGQRNKVLWLTDLMYPGKVIEGVKDITYESEFPKIKISSSEIPVTIEYNSFFIPGDVKNSSLPAVLIRVKGKGKLYFIFPMPDKGVGNADGKKVVLKSDSGELGILSCGSGKAFATVQGCGGFWSACQSKHSEGYVYAGVCWDGKFDDELILAWHFPQMHDFSGNFIGHNYANYFNSCDEVIDYVYKNKETLKEKTVAFHKSIYKNRKLADSVRDAYSAQLSCFVKQSWLTKDGKFGVWEGSSGCCGLQTTDVSFYGSWLYVKLFPELEKSAIRLTAEFQREDGWIPHFFPGTFTKIDEYRRKDMNMQFALMVARNYYLWNDKEFLQEMYPRVKKAIEQVYDWDTDGDKIPDIEGPDQTFDVWDWKGCSIYLASLWLATLYIGAKLARETGDTKYVAKWTADANNIKKVVIEKLWNGEYFILWNNGKEKDDGCLLDALPGEWYFRLLGFDYMLPKEMVESHLTACWKYNRKKVDASYMEHYHTPGETGWCYINGGYKDNRRYCVQQYEPWTGIEYTFAIYLYLAGQKEKAGQVVADVHNRKLKCGMAFNHIECGGDYFRPLVIGALIDLIR